MKAANIPFSKIKKSILVYSVIACLCFIVFVLLLRFFNLLHVWGLRMANYAIFCVISMYQVRHWIKQYKGYVRFLKVFAVSLTTGAAAFTMFAVFLFIYSWFDPYLNEMYVTHSIGQQRLIPSVIVFFEGTGGSIIIALIAAIYASRYEDGEVSP
jgi:hypothetical protein